MSRLHVQRYYRLALNRMLGVRAQRVLGNACNRLVDLRLVDQKRLIVVSPIVVRSDNTPPTG